MSASGEILFEFVWTGRSFIIRASSSCAGCSIDVVPRLPPNESLAVWRGHKFLRYQTHSRRLLGGKFSKFIQRKIAVHKLQWFIYTFGLNVRDAVGFFPFSNRLNRLGFRTRQYLRLLVMLHRPEMERRTWNRKRANTVYWITVWSFHWTMHPEEFEFHRKGWTYDELD